MIRIETFGFKWGLPPADTSWVADVRDIDSWVYDGLEDRNGYDPKLSELIVATSTAEAWFRKFEFDVLKDMKDDDLIAVGCSHGQHRSIAIAEVFAEMVETAGFDVQRVDRDLAKNEGQEEAGRDTAAKVIVMNSVKAAARNWYEIRNASADTAEIYIYDQIGADWFSEGVTAKNFIGELNAITAGNIDLHVNSPGGSVFDGVAIFNALKRHPATVTTYVDGLAASIASVIALAGDRVIMASNALFMIHNPWGSVQGDSADMRKMADVLDKIRETLVGSYTDKTGIAAGELHAMMDAETWFTADEALTAGFVDEVGVEMQIAATFDVRAMGFKRAPLSEAEQSDVIERVTLENEEPEPADPETGGASDSVPSDGASEEPNNGARSTAYVAGVGFVNFGRKE